MTDSPVRKYFPQKPDATCSTSIGCKPKLHSDPKNVTDKSACQASNEFAINFIKKHKLARVFVVQSTSHQLTDWKEMARLVKANQGELVLVGSVPQWSPSLPVIVARDLKAKHDYVATALFARYWKQTKPCMQIMQQAMSGLFQSSTSCAKVINAAQKCRRTTDST